MRPPSTLLQLNAILVLFCAAAMLFKNVADGQQDTLGLGGLPVPAKNEEIDLPNGTKLTKDKKEFKEYQHNDKTFEPCNLEFNKDGNIEVFYDDLASTKGCTVDLLFDKMDQIKFVAKVEDKDKKCVTKEVYDNLLPFIFNEANNRLAALTGGPEYGGDDCTNKENCGKGKCIKRTMYDIAWSRGEDDSIRGYFDQVDEPVAAWSVLGKSDEARLDVEMAVGVVPKNAPLVTIKALDVEGAESVKFPGKSNPICNKPRKATPPPAIWKVNSENKEFNGKYFVTFHFFPQTSAGVDGPKCNGTKQPSFVFSKNYASLLMVALPATTTKMTTIGSTKATRIGSTKVTKIGLTTTHSNASESTAPMANTTATTPAEISPETTEPNGGLLIAALIGIVAGSVLLLIIASFVIWCCCCRKKAADDFDDQEGGEGVDDEHEGKESSSNSKEVGEATDWVNYETVYIGN